MPIESTSWLRAAAKSNKEKVTRKSRGTKTGKIDNYKSKGMSNK